MGRSTSSCFKIIACGSDSGADKDDAEAPEIKGDKRGWSFRKRSAQHRVLSNTVILETIPALPSAVKKEASESTASVNFEPITDVEVPEKVLIPQCDDEKPQIVSFVDSKQSDPAPLVDMKNESAMDVEIEESTIVLIQSSVRGFLAQRKILKLKKNVIKLQAAVRGHLVRRHAVGTLRCVQAIVKMQVLVRARRARAYSPADNQAAEDRPNEGAPELNDSDKENANNKPTVSYVSIEKLLSNRFARQLLESTPRERPINIKCDRSKPNSAWKWLERWMSASSAEPTSNIDLTTELPKSEKDSSVSQAETKNSAEISLKPADSSFGRKEIEDDENLIIYEEEKVKFEDYPLDSQVLQEIADSHVGKEVLGPEHPQSDEMMASDDIILIESSAAERGDPRGKPEMESEQPKHSMKRSASEELKMEEKKSGLGSKKATNPAFLAAQSKFEELSSAANSSALINRSDELELEITVPREGSEYGMKESNPVESSVNDQARLQVGGSECGTELSISSTLDSPDTNDAAKEEFGRCTEIPQKDSSSYTVHNDLMIEPESTEIPDTALSNTLPDHPEKHSDDVVSGSTSNKPVVTENVQQDTTMLKLQTEVNVELVQQVHNGTSGDSPRSHITVPESQATPASQVSVDTKGSKFDKIGSSSNHKRKLVSNRSPSSPYNDSSASSVNKQGKDQKSSKRRNSFGSAKPENADQEQRESSSSSSSTLPHFMQATESAKAKVHANNSPRSSPDVSDRETFIKKRQSHPGGNGRHGSPQIQRSTSQAQAQAQQGRKANSGPTQVAEIA
ncbi:hypothetical protein SAY86_016210 [Trapa natans]|uniref:DUF4005 domain-containing protein n=1 Tax=Trapa natans TaxID=22666 RepID=A0AAN7LFN9_TRANT|nr:hypothetical protein SAY86_016210 [Trapa natans]